MRRGRLAVSALFAAVATLITGAAIPAAATTPVDTITVVTAGNLDSGVGELYVEVFATTQITSITAHIMSGATDKLDLSDFAFDAMADVWLVTSPITQAQLPLGSYTVKVDVTDMGGSSVTGVEAGPFDYLIQPQITVTGSPAVIDYDHQLITFSGSIDGLYPDGTVKGLANQALTLTDGGGGFSQQLTTKADGSFQVTITPDFDVAGIDTAYWLTIAQSDTVAAATTVTTPVQFSVHQDQVKATAKLSQADAAYQRTVTVTGTVSYQPQSAFVPLVGAAVQLWGIANGRDRLVGSATTGPAASSRCPSPPFAI